VDIVHILCVGHFVIRAKHSLELKGQVIWDLSLSGRCLPQSATQPQMYDQVESKRHMSCPFMNNVEYNYARNPMYIIYGSLC